MVKLLDSASPELKVECASADPIDQVRLTLREPGAGDYFLEIVLWDVRVTSVASTFNTGAPSPQTETVRFSFEKIRWTYRTAGGDTVVRCWDLKGNVDC